VDYIYISLLVWQLEFMKAALSRILLRKINDGQRILFGGRW
jgi:hypothetical protein